MTCQQIHLGASVVIHCGIGQADVFFPDFDVGEEL